MLLPTPSRQSRCSPSVIHRSASAPSDVQPLDHQRVQSRRGGSLICCVDLAPAHDPDRPRVVQEAGLDDLLPVLLDLDSSRLGGHRRACRRCTIVQLNSPLRSPSPAPSRAPVVASLAAWRICLAGSDRRRRRARVGRGDQSHQVVIDLIDHRRARTGVGQEVELLVAGELVERALRTLRSRLGSADGW